MTPMKDLCIAFLAPLVLLLGVPVHAQSPQSPTHIGNGSDPQVSQVVREPARVARRPFRFPRRHGTASDYGTVIANLDASYSIQLARRERRKLLAALQEYADTIPSGNSVDVSIIYDGLRFKRLHVPAPGAPWDVLFLGRSEHAERKTVRGTNVQMAKELGYRCIEIVGCFSPEEWDELMGVCSVRGPAALRSAGSPCFSTDPDGNLVTPVGVEQAALGSATGLMDTIRAATSTALQPGNSSAEGLSFQERMQIHAANMRGYRRTVFLAQTLAGFSDPEFGRTVGVVGDSVLDAYEAIYAFGNLPPSANENLAAIGLTGELVSAGLTLAALSADSGPSAEQVILDGINALRESVQEIRTEMNERFDQVHDHLDLVYASMVEGFNVLLDGNRRSFRSVIAQLDDARRRMTELARVQLDSQAIVLQQSDFLARMIADLQLAGCERPLAVVSPVAFGTDNGSEAVLNGTALNRFRKCRDKIAALHGSLFVRHQLPLPNATTTMAAWLERRPDQTISWDYAAFKRLLAKTGPEAATRARALPDAVVGPEAWFALMDLHDGFLMMYPGFAARDLPYIRTTAFSVSMNLHRSNLVRFGEAVRDELRAFQGDLRPTVFSELFKEAWNPDRLVALLRNTGDPYRLFWDCLESNMSQPTSCDTLASIHSSEHVRAQLLGMVEFHDLADSMSIASSHLQHWLKLAVRSQIGLSDSVTRMATGWSALPDLRSIVKNSDVGFESWLQLVNTIDEEVDNIARTLRSADFVSAASGPWEHELLMEFEFPSLGDVELEQICCDEFGADQP